MTVAQTLDREKYLWHIVVYYF